MNVKYPVYIIRESSQLVSVFALIHTDEGPYSSPRVLQIPPGSYAIPEYPNILLDSGDCFAVVNVKYSGVRLAWFYRLDPDGPVTAYQTGDFVLFGRVSGIAELYDCNYFALRNLHIAPDTSLDRIRGIGKTY